MIIYDFSQVLCHFKGLGLPCGAAMSISLPSPTLSFVSADETRFIALISST